LGDTVEDEPEKEGDAEAAGEAAEALSNLQVKKEEGEKEEGPSEGTQEPDAEAKKD
jgi:hypothetical protein